MTGPFGAGPTSGRLAYRAKIGAALVVLVLLSCACLAWVVSRQTDEPDQATGVPTPTPPPSRTVTAARPTWTWSPVGPQVVMPNVVGKNAAVAAEELAALGFTRVLCTTPDEDDGFLPTAEWTVAEQPVAAGTTTTAGDGPFYLRCEPVR